MNICMNKKNKLRTFLLDNKIALIVMALLFIVRVIAMTKLGVTYSLNSDDLSYVNSGIEFKNTGAITMHGVISAQIMPGMPVFIGLFSKIFGDGNFLWLALKITWIMMGCISSFDALSQSFAPKWCGILVMLLFFRPDYIWMDNIILTETPFMLCFLSTVYFTLMMGRTQEKKILLAMLINVYAISYVKG